MKTKLLSYFDKVHKHPGGNSMRLQTQAVIYLLLLVMSGAARAEDAPTLQRGIETDAGSPVLRERTA
ncbi:MAG: hypothetical protein ACREVJ_02850, partial [Gammaproteobacteria bacterium]